VGVDHEKTMHRAAALSAALTTFGTTSYVLAADLPPAPPPAQAPAAFVPTPVYNWTGIYVGINGGWGWGNGKFTNAPNAAFPGGVSGSPNDNGGFVGGTLGANFQTGALVLGVEGDWDYSGINTGTSMTICNITGTCQTGNNWLATIRGRAGYAVDRVMFYLTAGGAFANVQTTFNGVTNSHAQAGWTAGLGMEWAFANNWSAKIEYLYANIGSGTINCSTPACTAANGGAVIPVSVSPTENLLRFGVNYRF
jgi:outer membrane immunogenic protein